MRPFIAIIGALAVVVVVGVVVVVVLLSGPDAPSPAVSTPTSTPVTGAPTPTSTPAAVVPTPTASATPTPTVPANRAPDLASIGDQTVALGSGLGLELSASDPEGEAVSFGVSPLPLMPNASLNTMTGSFVFTPDAAQVGSFELTFLVSDGEGGTASETVTITVEAPPPGGVTSLVGRILDANDFVGGIETPVVGATVSLLGVGASTVSDADGRFALTGIPGDSQVFDIDVSTADPAPDDSPYAGFREELHIIPGDLRMRFFKVLRELLVALGDPVADIPPTLAVTWRVPPLHPPRSKPGGKW